MEIKVTRFNKEHVKDRVRWINDPRVHEYMYFDVPVSEEGTQKWLDRSRADPSRVDLTFHVEGSAAAMGGLTNISRRHNTAELYVMVSPHLHSRGVGTFATKWITNYGFACEGLNKVYLETDATNLAAINLYNKLGFSLEGIARQQRCRGGKYVDRVAFGLVRHTWRLLEWSTDNVRLEEH